MNVIRAGFGDDVDDRAGIAAVLGVEGIGNDAKFFDSVGRWLDAGRVHEDIVGVASVDHVIVGTAATAIDRDDARIIAAIEKIRAEL